MRRLARLDKRTQEAFEHMTQMTHVRQLSGDTKIDDSELQSASEGEFTDRHNTSMEQKEAATSGKTSGYSTPGLFRKQVSKGEVSFIKNRVKNYNENVIYSNIKKHFTKWKRMARGTGKRGKSKPI